jgi:hypothetical protein
MASEVVAMLRHPRQVDSRDDARWRQSANRLKNCQTAAVPKSGHTCPAGCWQ